MAATNRSRYCAEGNLVEFFHRHDVVYYWTFTFAENLQDKDEAERRAKPLFDLIRRRQGEHWHCWEHQERGAWHMHMVTDLYFDVVKLRPWMVQRGWGPIMKVRRVASPRQYSGEGWQREDSAERGLIRYLLKYLTKAIRSADKWTKPWGCSSAAHNFVTSFRWVPWVNAHCWLYHMGKQFLERELGEKLVGLPSLEYVAAATRMGYEVMGWADVDPWFYL